MKIMRTVFSKQETLYMKLISRYNVASRYFAFFPLPQVEDVSDRDSLIARLRGPLFVLTGTPNGPHSLRHCPVFRFIRSDMNLSKSDFR